MAAISREPTTHVAPRLPAGASRLRTLHIAADPRATWLGEPFGDVITGLRTAVLTGAGAVVLTGETGTGKSTVANTLAALLRPNGVVVGRVDSARRGAGEFRQAVAAAYGWAATGGERFAARAERFLVEADAREIRVLLVVEDAQRLATDVAGEIAHLLDRAQRIGAGRGSPLTAMLVGGDDLLPLLDAPDTAMLKSHVKVCYRLRRLTEHEVRHYIGHRLVAAGMARDLFPSATVTNIAQMSGGIPRIIDFLCDRALAEAAEGRVADLGTVQPAGPAVSTSEPDRPSTDLVVTPTPRQPRPVPNPRRRRIAAIVVGGMLTAAPLGYMVHNVTRREPVTPSTPLAVSEPAPMSSMPADPSSSADTTADGDASRSEAASTTPTTAAPRPLASETLSAPSRTLSAVPSTVIAPASERRPMPLAAASATHLTPPVATAVRAATATPERATARPEPRTPSAPRPVSPTPGPATSDERAAPAGRYEGPDPTSIIDWVLRDAGRRAD